MACSLAACGLTRPSGTLQLAGQSVDVGAMTAAQVRAEVVVVGGANELRRYRAPTLRLVRALDLRGGAGPTVPGRTGTVEVARAGYLFGERAAARGTTRHFLVYQSDLVRGENRYARVALADGRALSFRTVTSKPAPCDADCFPIVQSVIAEVPDDALRAAGATGLTVTMTLDNGHTFTVSGPAAYVQGYLDAVDADAGRAP